MADEEPSGVFVAQAQVLGGPVVVDDGTMDDIIDKLKILGYETEFCPTGKPAFKLLSKGYFTGPSDNANAQFFYFTSLVSWLMTKAGHNNFPPPGQFDDPNATATNILQELKALSLQTRDLPPNRIRQGHGDVVLTILTMLVDKALISQNFTFRPVIYPVSKEGGGDDETQELEGKMGTDGAEGSDIDDHIDMDSEEGDELYVHRGFGAKNVSEEHEMIIPQVSAEAWNLEVERVGPSLQIRSDEIRDWRARIEGANTLLKAVEQMYPDVRVMLEHLGDELKKSQERILKREQTLSQQFSEQVEEYRIKLRDLNATQDTYNQCGQGVGGLSAELNGVSETVEQVKQQIQDRETKISDITPMNQIKEAVSKIRTEIKEMSLRIGVLQHTVLHYTLKQAKGKREKRNKTNGEQYYSDEEEEDRSMNLGYI